MRDARARECGAPRGVRMELRIVALTDFSDGSSYAAGGRRATQVVAVPRAKWIAVFAVGLSLSSCAGGVPSPASFAGSAAPATGGERDLTSREKQTIIEAVAPNLKDPLAARYHWVKFAANPSSDSVNYCSTVDAQSPYPPYDGRQTYLVEVHLTDNRITWAAMGIIAGGKDAALVAKQCAKYGLNPY